MAFNLCDSSIVDATISCDKPAFDGYEPINLLHSVSRGFLAETFIKPPVVLTLTFPFSVDLKSVCLLPCVSSQASLGFRLYSSPFVKPSPGLQRTSVEPSPTLIGQTLLDKEQPVCFINHMYRGSSRFPDDRHDYSCFKGALRKLYTNPLSSVNSVGTLHVHITRTAHGSIPCLNKLKVWGQPSRDTDEATKNAILQKLNQQCSNSCPVQSVSNPQGQRCYPSHLIPQPNAQLKMLADDQTNQALPKSVSEYYIGDGINVPLEFLDGLTFEFMPIPMLLPSGQTVDKRTLEKFIQEEAKWGRKPSDPFTGVPFTQSIKPVHHSTLKIRMDSFLSKNSIDVTQVPRTVGRNPNYVASNKSPDSGKSHKRKSHASGKDFKKVKVTSDDLRFQSTTKPVSLLSHNVSGAPSSATHSSSPSLKTMATGVSNTLVLKTCTQPSTPSVESVSSPTNQTNSLTRSLQQALRNLPRFQVKHSDAKILTPSCRICSLPDIQLLYKPPCQHLICKPCLSSKSGHFTLVCNICLCTFTKSSVEKFHV